MCKMSACGYVHTERAVFVWVWGYSGLGVWAEELELERSGSQLPQVAGGRRQGAGCIAVNQFRPKAKRTETSKTEERAERT
jgi:hypothetical protein